MRAILLKSLWLFCLLTALPVPAQEIEVPLFEGGEGMDFYLQTARRLEAARPGLKVNLYGDPRIADKMRIRVMEGSYPEVSNANLNYWSLLRYGRLRALDDALDAPAWEGEEKWRDTFLPGSLDGFTHEGKTYGIPLVNVVWSVYYNRAVFERLGLSPPRTWLEFYDVCKRLQAADIAPIAFQGRYPYYAQVPVEHNYYHLAGAQAYEAQKRLEPGSFDNPQQVEAFRLLQRATRFFQPGFLGMSHTEAQMQFFSGRAGMLFCGSWLVREMRDNIPENFELGVFNLPLPSSDHADPKAIYASTSYFFVFQDSENPELGIEFLKCMTSTQWVTELASADLPVAIVGANEQLSPRLRDLKQILENVEHTFGNTPGEGIPGMTQPWIDALYGVLSGSLTPERAAAKLELAAELARQRAANPDRIKTLYPGRAALLLLALAAAFLFAGGRRSGVAEATPGTRARGSFWLFLAPSLVVYLVFLILPSIAALILSLFRWDGIGPARYVGLLHFKRLLLESEGFWLALGNNAFLMLTIPLLVVPLSLFLAACIANGAWGSRFFRIAFFFPNLLGVAGILLWQQVYNPQGGPLNPLLVSLGFTSFEAYDWLSQEHLYWSLIPMSVWAACGFNMVLYLAAMQAVPESLYEAAVLDGAGPVRQFFSITVPQIRDALVVSFVFLIIGGLKAFEAIWLLTNQGPTTETHVIGTLMIHSMFSDMAIGQASAVAVLLFALVAAGSALTMKAQEEEPS